jgi:hypothetical protein
MATMLWLILTQVISSGGGGYVTGRLSPTEWSANNQELQGAQFYYMAHGLLVWALGSIAIAFLLGTAANNILSGGTSVMASVGKGVATGVGAGTAYFGNGNPLAILDASEDQDQNQISSFGRNGGMSDYVLDFLFRPSTNVKLSAGEANSAIKMQRQEIARIFANALWNKKMSEADKHYVARVIAERAGISQSEALKRVSETLDQINSARGNAEAQAKEALTSASQAAAMASLWTFAALFSGALVAGATACYGGSWSRRLIRSRKKAE